MYSKINKFRLRNFWANAPRKTPMGKPLWECDFYFFFEIYNNNKINNKM